MIEALGGDSSLQVHFLSSVDAHLRDELLARLDPAETAVIVVTKSFTTGETLLHARRVKEWMEQAMGRQETLQRCLRSVAISRQSMHWCIRANTLYLPDWVGGRYSLWSAVSLAAAAVMGWAFQGVPGGAAEMDRHFQEPRPAKLAGTGRFDGYLASQYLWYSAQVVIPYDYRLRSLPAYLQQLVMESNGKSVDRQGDV